MERYLMEFQVENKNRSEDTIRRWRKSVALVKNPSRRFRYVVDLAKRSEAEKKKLQIQEKIRMVLYVQKAALHFIDAGAGDRSNEKKKLQAQATCVEWVFLLTGLCLEILSLAFDQASSPSKPQYALFGMISAIAAVLVCIWELIYKGKKERVVLQRWGRLWWFYYPHSQHRLFGTVLDFYGLVGGIAQCICSTVQYICFRQHADNPIRASLWPAIFLICLGAKKLNDNRNEVCDEHGD
ncbi:hypothetical protein L3X38_037993 [Prunus dulcis]|uniref:Calcium-transporting P-type ATPase N-terminal autoinhibitory domain-containing protein n=1 Tax=Prunus dulcis TaxID=3755 RepID=A0AAD4V470_PRUDU|nr:hypothetical protein L3X38_037993 [Prunus dulcis]